MFKTIVATLLLAGSGVALASEASFDQKQLREEKAAAASPQKTAEAKTMTSCGCPHSS